MHSGGAVPNLEPEVIQNDVLSQKTQKTQISETLAREGPDTVARVSETWVFWFLWDSTPFLAIFGKKCGTASTTCIVFNKDIKNNTVQCNTIQYNTIYTAGPFFLLFYAVPLPPLRFLQSILFSIWLSRSGGVARHLKAFNYINLKQGHSDSADSLRVVHIFSLPRSRPLRGNSTFQNVPSSVAPQF